MKSDNVLSRAKVALQMVSGKVLSFWWKSMLEYPYA